MKALLETILEQPGICPAAESLAALTRPPSMEAWHTLRVDPGMLLFLARQLPGNEPPSDLLSLFHGDTLLLAAQDLPRRHSYIPWNTAGPDKIYHAARHLAALAEAIAVKVNYPSIPAWIAGFLAPLGWIGACATGVTPIKIVDHAALAGRIARAWRLPSWLSAIVAHLDLTTTLAKDLGADPTLFQIVQLAAGLTHRDGASIRLPLGSSIAQLQASLLLTDEECLRLVHGLEAGPIPAFTSPAQQPLVNDLLRLAIESRARSDRGWLERLECELESYRETLARHHADEKSRLQNLKLSALAEFAAGAGHEINNPLAVISGQAQYLLKQMAQAEELLVEDPTPAAYLDALKSKWTRSLTTIVGQSARIHHVITDLMHFARPQPPRIQTAPVARLIADAVASIRPLAADRQVRLVCPDASSHLAARVDPGQMRTALCHLLRNAVEAAPADGWVSLRVLHEAGGPLTFVVEDNGPGPSASQREHLFDPFFSGRSAGRGRGLGLSTAWQIARQHDGDVRFDGAAQGVTRFVLELPASAVTESTPAHGNGHHLGNGACRSEAALVG